MGPPFILSIAIRVPNFDSVEKKVDFHTTFMNTDENLAVYEQAHIVQEYVQSQRLTRGETVILQQHEALFRDKKVLDIGVGGGRTTPALAALAASYTGIDYSAAMVASCVAGFAGKEGIRFLQDDARKLAKFQDGSFDAAVFSFNGIDCVAMEDRPTVFAAVRRVLAPGGTFVFSFHNALYLPHLYRPHWSRNPLKWLSNYRHHKSWRH